MYNHIKMMQSSERITPEMLEELYSLNDSTYEELVLFDKEFMFIRNQNIALEDKIKQLDEYIDKKMSETSEEDLEASRVTCKETFKGYWNKFDDFTQDYLVMANYLFKVFSFHNFDFSPSVLEFGRALENELLEKIFNGYVNYLYSQRKNITYGEDYENLKKAVKYLKRNNWEFFIPQRAMVRYLTYLSEKDDNRDPNVELRKFLSDHKIDVGIIAEKTFTDLADEIFDKYRNNAAHPGTRIIKEEASICETKTAEALGIFMSAVKI